MTSNIVPDLGRCSKLDFDFGRSFGDQILFQTKFGIWKSVSDLEHFNTGSYILLYSTVTMAAIALDQKTLERAVRVASDAARKAGEVPRL